MADVTTRGMSEPTGEDVPDIGFSVEELQYLLSIAPGDGSTRSAEILGVAPVPPADEAILVGGAALLARGELTLTAEGAFELVDAALVVAFILTTATRWTSITGATKTTADSGAFIESPSGGLLAQPRTLGTWWFVILDPDAPPAGILVGAVMGLASEGETSGVLARTTTADTDRTVSVRRAGQTWAYAVGRTGNATPDGLGDNQTRADVLQCLETFLAEGPPS